MTLILKSRKIEKRVFTRFFMKNCETLKKYFFYKSPQNGQFLIARFLVST